MVSALLNLGLTVTRNIPPEVMIGLITGQYKMHGGVIRWAAGTPQAGQIVVHLVSTVTQPAFTPLFTPITTILGAVNTYQLHKLAGNVNQLTVLTQQVLQMATTTAVLSGLGLVVSAASFVVLNQKLNNIDQKLNEIQKDVKEVKDFLHLKQRAELTAVLGKLINLENIPSRHHSDILLNAEAVLAPLCLQYQELLTQANNVEMAMIAEEYFCTTTLAHVRCQAELGITGVGRQLNEAKKVWQTQTQRIAKDIVLGKSPERFLSSDFVADVPSSILIEWLDFAYNENKGYGWIDELRSNTKPWYPEKNTLAQRAKFATSQVITAPTKLFTKQSEMDKERNLFIPSIQKLVARNNVLEGYVMQHEMLESHKITPSELEKEIAQIPSESTVDGYVVLQPIEVNKKSSWFW